MLRAALQTKYNLELPNLRQEGINTVEPTTMEGFICNKQSHWFAIRKIHGKYWNLNSTLDRPELISHFKLATELDKLIADGYSVFCVPVDKPLPLACSTVQEMERRKQQHAAKGILGHWWKETDLLKGTSAKEGSQGGDPWKNVGSGMRLDGKSTAASNNNNNDVIDMTQDNWTHELTEEEQIQMAMTASLQPDALEANLTATNESKPAAMESVEVPPEPAAGTPGACRIQFRLPSNPKLIRRFMQTDTIAVLISFCQDVESHATMDLRYGFPPKDLKALPATQTIAEAKLAGESIQGRRI